MNMNTIKQELHKKIARMSRSSFDKFISDLEKCYRKTHSNNASDLEKCYRKTHSNNATFA